MILTTTEGETDLPRYFAQVFKMASDMQNGRIDFVLPDGRKFRAEGKNPGPVAELHIHNPDIFARLIREGDLGFCDAYLDEWWSTPDLQAFMAQAPMAKMLFSGELPRKRYNRFMLIGRK